MIPKKECIHIVEILRQAKSAILKKDALLLKDLSNKTIHSSCTTQDSASVTIAVIIYSLSKIIERDDYKNIKNWDNFVKKLNLIIDLAISALESHKFDKYTKYIEQARKTLTTHSITLKPYISEIMKKAAINKGSKIYEHGISLEQTSKLLGVSQWELNSYVGQKSNKETRLYPSMDIKQRAKMAMEFFS